MNGFAVIPPLTLTLSPLRGEGTAVECSDKHMGDSQVSRFCARGVGAISRDVERDEAAPNFSGMRLSSPSPLNGERAGVRGERGNEDAQ